MSEKPESEVDPNIAAALKFVADKKAAESNVAPAASMPSLREFGDPSQASHWVEEPKGTEETLRVLGIPLKNLENLLQDTAIKEEDVPFEFSMGKRLDLVEAAVDAAALGTSSAMTLTPAEVTRLKDGIMEVRNEMRRIGSTPQSAMQKYQQLENIFTDHRR